MKRYLILLTLVSFFTGLAAQNTNGKINTRYLRPSITMLFAEPKDADEAILINKFRNLEVPGKFDDHRIQFPDMKPVENTNPAKKTLLENYIRKASNPVIAKWWGRDEQGNFNYTLALPLVSNEGFMVQRL